MKQFRLFGVLALALAISMPAFAETQTVKVSGSIDAYWAYRADFDLSEGNDVALVPVNGTTVEALGFDADSHNGQGAQSDSANFWFSLVQVEVAADLTDNVAVVVNLFNQRDWNATSFAASSSGFTTAQDDEFDVGVDLAYIELKQIFYEPLSVVVGRFDIEFGRGFVLGNWNIQDPNSSLTLDEYSAVTSYDGGYAVLDFNPWTVHFVGLNLRQGAVNAEDDRNFFFTNINYQFSEYNAEWELYFGYDHNRIADTSGAAVGSTREAAKDSSTYLVGTRAQYDPIEPLTLGAEVGFQFGQQETATTTGVLAGPTPAGQSREAWAFDLFGEYRWSEHAYTPYVGLEYVYLGGDQTDTTEYEGWNGLFRSPTYGIINDYLETYYQTALVGDSSTSTNHQHLSVSGGFAPMDDLKIDGVFYWFWTEEDVFNTTGSVSSENVGQEKGSELDIFLTYDYTEDVTFGVSFAWFFPGEIYDQASKGTFNGPLNDEATAITGHVGVAF